MADTSRFDPLSEAERRLLTALATGDMANCGPAGVAWDAPDNDPAQAETWGRDRMVRAVLLEWLCTDPTAAGQIHHGGIRLAAARIDGILDLSFVKVSFPLSFLACAWPQGMRLHGAEMPELRLPKCRVAPLPPGRELRKTAIRAAGLRVRNAVFLNNGFHAEGEINLLGADIGSVLDCTDGSRFKNPEGVALNAERAKIGGAVLLRNKFEAEGEVRLFNADIGGLECSGNSRFKNPKKTALNAERAKIGGPVFLRKGFEAEGEVRLVDADIGGLECERGSSFKNPGETALNAAAAKIGGAVLLRNEFEAEGEVKLVDAEMGGLECSGNSRFKNPKRTALNAGRAKIGGPVFLRGGFEAEGEVSLFNADIGGLECERGSTFRNPGKTALNAERAKIGGPVLLREGFEAEGEVRLFNADIGGLACEHGSSFKNPGKTALNAARAKIGGAVLLRDKFEAEGEVRLVDAGMDRLECSEDSRFKNPEGTALNAARAKIGGAVILRNKFEAEGEVRLFNADIGGLECVRGSSFKNPGETALNAARAKIGGPVLLRDGFEAEGEVVLFNADIGGLECARGSSFKNPGETALNAARAKIGGPVLLRYGFEAEGEVRLFNATVHGNLVIANSGSAGTDDTSPSTLSLLLRGARIDGGLVLDGLRCAADTAIDLEDASCNVLVDAKGGWPSAGNLVLDGFAYRRLRDPLTPAQRLDWLRRQVTPDEQQRSGQFRPQPYRQLAGVLRAQGLDAEAKEILIGMARDRRRWADLTPASRFWHWILWITIRNGYQPLRAGYGLLILWLIGFFAFGLGYQAQVMVPSERIAYHDFTTGTLPGQYEPFCALVYSIDTSLPIIGFGQKDRWHPRLMKSPPPRTEEWQADDSISNLLCKASFTRRLDPNAVWVSRAMVATILEFYRWFHLACGWFLATMLLAGISGLVGRE